MNPNRRALFRAGLGGVLAGIAAIPSQANAQALAEAGPVAVDVNARPIAHFSHRDRSRIRFDQLDFRSGLILTSPFRDFGGLSGLRLDAKGEKFVAVSDKGNWFTGRLTYREKILTGFADVEAAPMLASDGRPIRKRGWYDTEALASDGNTIWIGIERANLILKYDFGRDGVRALGQLVAAPPGLRKLPYNKGLEALVMMPKGHPLAGALLAISERGLDADGNIIGFLIGGARPGAFAVKRLDPFDVSDAALLPDGDLLLLERRFSLLGGVGIQIRRIAPRGIFPGAVIDGPIIFTADLGDEIDNMEAIAVHRMDDGDTVITMVSDDNFSFIQRTLLLQFTLVET